MIEDAGSIMYIQTVPINLLADTYISWQQKLNVPNIDKTEKT